MSKRLSIYFREAGTQAFGYRLGGRSLPLSLQIFIMPR